MMDASCSIDVVMVKGLGNMLFGGEGFFNTVVTGPEHIMLQTQPISQFISRIAAALSATRSN